MADSDYRAALIDAANAIIDRAGSDVEVPMKAPDVGVWTKLVEAGFAALDVTEELGGSGGTLADALDILAVTARRGVSTPMVEHGVLAAWLAGQAGLSLPDGIATVAVATEAMAQAVGDGDVVLDGLIEAVPWAAEASTILVLVDPGSGHESRVALVSLADPTVQVHAGTDLVGAPLNDVSFAGTVPATVASTEVTRQVLRRRGALAYTAAIAGAARRVCDLTIEHARGRTQFGRPLAQFQAVQQRLAQLASITTAVESATDAAVADHVGTRSVIAVASAAVVASFAVQEISAAGHQIHGAIGFTSEYGLGRATTSLWSWRDRHGSADYWSDVLAGESLDNAIDVWELITGHPDAAIDDQEAKA